MRLGVLLFAALAATSVASAGPAAPRSAPPSGHEWQELADVRGSVLKPARWHFKRHVQGTTLGFFVTREDIDAVGFFDTGLSINVFRLTEEGAAARRAEAFISARAEADADARVSIIRSAPFVRASCVTKDQDANDGRRFRTRSVAIANTRTNVLYIAWFEAPEEVWERDWEKGRQMLDELTLDPEW